MAKPSDPQQLSAPEFREFLEHIPNYTLALNGITRRAVWGVGMSLAQHVDYGSGTRARATQITLAEDSGTDRKTVRRVLTFLKAKEVLKVTGEQRHNVGTTSEIYSFRRSVFVDQVLNLKDRHWTPEAFTEETSAEEIPQAQTPEAKQEVVNSSPEGLYSPLEGCAIPIGGVRNPHNKTCNTGKTLAPTVALSPDGASDGAVKIDDVISESWMGSEVDFLVAGI
ncbi:hypothetical protein FHS07_002350 [Microbacterium proteolyticum]|uniref:Helix-turn-helix domain-containing protein n=1 Tax=Microbacterium proteolyticum TaxID=1572644 RepID=A0A7W5CJW3_9MICO|nr:hypothetical protein [Microbacterium proteolyticum]MBB3158654.1 hypothetical protein [Microbacterium proteolyticum]